MFRSRPTAFAGYIMVILVGVAVAFASKGWFADGVFWTNVYDMSAVMVFLGVGLIYQAYLPFHTILILGLSALTTIVYIVVFM